MLQHRAGYREHVEQAKSEGERVDLGGRCIIKNDQSLHQHIVRALR
eukprot:SAG22_NODE_19026_length_279_cov_0.300000_1_plen_45_part_10